MSRRRFDACGQCTFTGWRPLRDHFGDWLFRTVSSSDSQLVADKLAFILNTPLVASILHGGDDREALWPTSAFLDDVKKLRKANRSCDLSAFVFEIEIGR